MRVFILDTNYSGFTDEFWADASRQNQSYEQNWRALMNECFGTADFYSYHLAPLGVEAREFIANDFRLQSLWARENGVALPPEGTDWRLTRRLKIVPYLRREASQRWKNRVLRAQVEAFAPDVIYVQDIHATDIALLRAWKAQGLFIAGQIASPLARRDLSVYDVVFSSFPHFDSVLRACGTKFRYFRIGFETRVLDKLGVRAATLPHDTVFGGGLSGAHTKRTQFLEAVAREVRLDVWGYGAASLSPDSPLRVHHHGEAWGLSMVRVLSEAKIALNIHIDVAQNNANNMRLFEATGVGSLLLTDQKANLGDLFHVGSEIAAFRNAEDCAAQIRELLSDETRRAAIARAGQERTLHDHSYARRMEELKQMLGEEMGSRR